MPRTIMVLIIMFCVNCHANTARLIRYPPFSDRPIIACKPKVANDSCRTQRINPVKTSMKISCGITQPLASKSPGTWKSANWARLCFAKIFVWFLSLLQSCSSSKGIGSEPCFKPPKWPENSYPSLSWSLKCEHMCIVWHYAASNTAQLWWFYNHLLNLSWNSCSPFPILFHCGPDTTRGKTFSNNLAAIIWNSRKCSMDPRLRVSSPSVMSLADEPSLHSDGGWHHGLVQFNPCHKGSDLGQKMSKGPHPKIYWIGYPTDWDLTPWKTSNTKMITPFHNQLHGSHWMALWLWRCHFGLDESRK